MSRQDIADYLGLTIETVSRTLTKLARKKALVIVPDGVRLLSVSALEQLAVRRDAICHVQILFTSTRAAIRWR